MNKEINEIFKQWKQLLSWCYETNDKTTEIHRDNLEMVIEYTRQLENIIKEAIEYIEEAQEESGDKESCSLYIPKLLEILKGVDK